ncbi:sigma-54-dependent Fis family transcriptional regulator [Pelobacter seleniigenes]|uniref:sigma-54-dependent Fis family transcriptional regulator n=1 Tax=Pelobacter seleniigenes TaxID=407188 RepID=UPI0004A6B8F7|nr:sigma-54-dependent Fis family transcriptional regulator [Pelobacter seleniigenes]
MAKILYIVPNEQGKIRINALLEEHRKDYIKSYPARSYVDVEVVVGIDAVPLVPRGLNADAIVARGILATNLIKAIPSVPVIRVPVTTADITLAVQALEKNGQLQHKIAVIGLGLVPYQIQRAEEICGKELILIEPHHHAAGTGAISDLFRYALENGCRHFIGGATVVKLAQSAGFQARLLHSSSESIWAALTQVQQISEIKRQSREHTVRFETIFNHSGEGIIAIDHEKKIVQINPTAAQILQVDEINSLGSSIEDIIPDSTFKSLLAKNRNYSNVLLKSKSNQIILNKDVTSLGNEEIGSILTFQEISRVQLRETKIRKRLHHRDHHAKHTFEHILGKSKIMCDTIGKAKSFAGVSSSVLIVGETGTGKELFAQSMHNASIRKDASFVAVNCAAIPDNLLESEFFGYIGGAFTGAAKEGKMGLFEIAHNGTIFLDEIAEIPLSLQSKLLRVIQEGEVMRLGHDKIIPVDVRIFCATNQNLWQLVEDGKFRADLYFRLSVLHLNIPSLKERQEDIEILADHFINQFSSSHALQKAHLTVAAKKTLRTYPWVGNIRELSNVCEQLIVLNQTGSIDKEEIQAVLKSRYQNHRNTQISPQPHKAEIFPPVSFSLHNQQRNLIIEALRENNFNRSKTAQSLGIDRSTLWRKMKEYNITPFSLG